MSRYGRKRSSEDGTSSVQSTASCQPETPHRRRSLLRNSVSAMIKSTSLLSMQSFATVDPNHPGSTKEYKQKRQKQQRQKLSSFISRRQSLSRATASSLAKMVGNLSSPHRSTDDKKKASKLDKIRNKNNKKQECSGCIPSPPETPRPTNGKRSSWSSFGQRSRASQESSSPGGDDGSSSSKASSLMSSNREERSVTIQNAAAPASGPTTSFVDEKPPQLPPMETAAQESGFFFDPVLFASKQDNASLHPLQKQQDVSAATTASLPSSLLNFPVAAATGSTGSLVSMHNHSSISSVSSSISSSNKSARQPSLQPVSHLRQQTCEACNRQTTKRSNLVTVDSNDNDESDTKGDDSQVSQESTKSDDAAETKMHQESTMTTKEKRHHVGTATMSSQASVVEDQQQQQRQQVEEQEQEQQVKDLQLDSEQSHDIFPSSKVEDNDGSGAKMETFWESQDANNVAEEASTPIRSLSSSAAAAAATEEEIVTASSEVTKQQQSNRSLDTPTSYLAIMQPSLPRDTIIGDNSLNACAALLTAASKDEDSSLIHLVTSCIAHAAKLEHLAQDISRSETRVKELLQKHRVLLKSFDKKEENYRKHVETYQQLLFRQERMLKDLEQLLDRSQDNEAALVVSSSTSAIQARQDSSSSSMSFTPLLMTRARWTAGLVFGGAVGTGTIISREQDHLGYTTDLIVTGTCVATEPQLLPQVKQTNAQGLYTNKPSKHPFSTCRITNKTRMCIFITTSCIYLMILAVLISCCARQMIGSTMRSQQHASSR